MAIVGTRPASGVRIVLERGREGPPWRYEGHAHTKEASFAVIAVVQADGSVEISGEAPATVVQRVQGMVRTVWKQAKQDDRSGSPPLRIQRWRAGG